MYLKEHISLTVIIIEGVYVYFLQEFLAFLCVCVCGDFKQNTEKKGLLLQYRKIFLCGIINLLIPVRSYMY